MKNSGIKSAKKMVTVKDVTTLSEAKQFLSANWETGADCPCCGQLVKLYKIPFRAGMAKVLIDIYTIMQKENKTWVHVIDEVKPVNGDYAKLRFWGLLADKGDEPAGDKKASGYWSVTALGAEFINGQASIPSKVHIYNNEKWGQATEFVTIEQALGTPFSWKSIVGEPELPVQESLL